MATKPQTKNLKTTCDLCGKEYNNSGYTQHRRKCEKNHATPPEEEEPKPEPEHVDAELVDDPRKGTKEKPTSAENTIHIIDHTAKEEKTAQNGFEKFFSALGDFVNSNSELFTAAAATVAGAYAEKQQSNEQNNQPQSKYGKW